MTLAQAGIEIDIDDNGYPGARYWCPECRAEVWCRVEWVQGARWGTNALVCAESHAVVNYDINEQIIVNIAGRWIVVPEIA